MSAASVTVNVRILVDGKRMPPMWRVRLVALAARLLRVPLKVA